MSLSVKLSMTLYAAVLVLVSLVGVAFAENGAACAATWTKTLYPDGSAVFGLYCEQASCPEPCMQTGNAGFGTQFSTCRCPGQLIYCNAAIRNIDGWSSEEQCLGGCTQSSSELCPNVEEEPWTFEGFDQDDNPTFAFVCDCA
ncbi:MAG TPA: hypothetical protein VFY93_01770 [Planctomycetota bacterium]|nr:hypothetical protein [Planctomycetota bacterium]